MGNILVCDDERSICEMLDIALRRDGHKVETVNSGEHAKRKLDGALYDVVVTDIKMPGINGIEVLRHAHQISPDSAVILITAAFALGGFVGSLVGLVIGYLSFRAGLRGSYFALVTLAFAEVLRIVASVTPITGAGVGTLIKLDLRTVTANVEQQEGITRDNVPIKVDAVIWFRIVISAFFVADRTSVVRKGSMLCCRTNSHSIASSAPIIRSSFIASTHPLHQHGHHPLEPHSAFPQHLSED